MKRTVRKYSLPLSGPHDELNELDLPRGSEILKIGDQTGIGLQAPAFCIWALVDPEESKIETRFVLVLGTGHEIPAAVLEEHRWARRESVIGLNGCVVLHVWISEPSETDE